LKNEEHLSEKKHHTQSKSTRAASTGASNETNKKERKHGAQRGQMLGACISKWMFKAPHSHKEKVEETLREREEGEGKATHTQSQMKGK